LNVQKTQLMMDSNDKVSIIIPTYNRTTYLNKAIDSVLSQTYHNIELIIIDDSSSDKVKKLCSSYSDKVRYFHRVKKSDIASAINFALQNMKGDWYKWMSDDDTLPKNAIEKFINHAKNSNAQILYPHLEYIDRNDEVVGTRIQQSFLDKYQFAALFWIHQIVISASLFIHKSCFDIVGLFENNYETAFDYKWCLKALVLHDYQFVQVPEILYQFRIHEEQSSIKNIKNHVLLVAKIRGEVKQDIKRMDPNKWRLFESYIKEYRNTRFNESKSKSVYISNKLRRFVPLNLRRMRHTLKDKIDNSNKRTICKICKHWDKETILHVKPDSNSIQCSWCNTIYSGQSFKRLVNEIN